MVVRSLLAWMGAAVLAAAAEPGALFEAAEQLSRGNQKREAMAKVEEAVAQLERAHAAGEKISWQGYNGLRFAARLAREDFLDHEKALVFCDKLFELADGDYWRVPARLERALTYRAMGDFAKAQEQYDAIEAGDTRYRAGMLLPRAEMVLFDLEDRERGRSLLEEALRNSEVNGRERFGSLRKCAEKAMGEGRRDEALGWYAQLETLPFEKAQERAGFLSEAWYEMGRIEESRGNAEAAKVHYRKAMELAEGEMRYRVRARDALESIEYFE
ncbi:MAG: hypothetical protein ACYC6Y_22625 [Thermoguttaceae bacterium]